MTALRIYIFLYINFLIRKAIFHHLGMVKNSRSHFFAVTTSEVTQSYPVGELVLYIILNVVGYFACLHFIQREVSCWLFGMLVCFYSWVGY